jgi:hypothetical protein
VCCAVHAAHHAGHRRAQGAGSIRAGRKHRGVKGARVFKLLVAAMLLLLLLCMWLSSRRNVWASIRAGRKHRGVKGVCLRDVGI